MADTNIPSNPVSGNLPVVFQRAGAVFTNSRDVAAFFEKSHRHVLRDIENLMAALPEGGLPNFGHTPYVDPQNGQTYKSYDLTKDGFTLLAMGFTGPKALGFKLRYIEQFNAMETALKTMPEPVAIDLSNPDQLLQLLTSYALDKKALMAKVEAQEPTVTAFNRISGADGGMCMTDAAKVLQVQPKKVLIPWLVANKWVYGRVGKTGHLAYQDKIQAGLLKHKVRTVEDTKNGGDKVVESVLVTPAGIAKLAKLVPGAVRPGELTLTTPSGKGNGTAATLEQGAAA